MPKLSYQKKIFLLNFFNNIQKNRKIPVLLGFFNESSLFDKSNKFSILFLL
jgi:hypothetical protein